MLLIIYQRTTYLRPTGKVPRTFYQKLLNFGLNSLHKNNGGFQLSINKSQLTLQRMRNSNPLPNEQAHWSSQLWPLSLPWPHSALSSEKRDLGCLTRAERTFPAASFDPSLLSNEEQWNIGISLTDAPPTSPLEQKCKIRTHLNKLRTLVRVRGFSTLRFVRGFKTDAANKARHQFSQLIDPLIRTLARKNSREEISSRNGNSSATTICGSVCYLSLQKHPT